MNSLLYKEQIDIIIMKNDYLKYYKSNVLIFLVVFLFITIAAARDHWKLSISVFSLVTTVLILITTYLWKYKMFTWLFWVDDFSGRYEGKIIYQYKDELGKTKTGELKHVKLINQTGSRITVSSFTIRQDGTKSSLSVNKGMHVEKTDDEQHYRLIYNYLNEGSKEQGFPPHYGTEVIKFIKNKSDKTLSGGYYTEREPFQTKGVFSELKWVNNNLNHEF
jgi:hypothetical protein